MDNRKTIFMRRLAKAKRRMERLDEQIGKLMGARVDLENEMADLYTKLES